MPKTEREVVAPTAYYYVDEETGLGRYTLRDRLIYKSNGQKLTRTDVSTEISYEEQKIIIFMDKNGLFDISCNQEALAKLMNGEQWLEYAYTYNVEKISGGVGYSMDGNYIPYFAVSSSRVTNDGWTNDPTQTKHGKSKIEFTGLKRLATPI